MKHLPKHLRPKWRYVAVAIEADPDVDLDRGAFQRASWYAAQNLLGDAVSADLDGTVVRFRARDGDAVAVVRVRRDCVESARAALACIDELDGSTVGVRILGVSGTIRACEETYVSEPSGITERRDVDVEGERRTAMVRGSRVAVDGPGHWTYATRRDVRADRAGIDLKEEV